jgi:hypothetical protein
VSHFSNVGLVRRIEADKTSQKTKTVLHNDSALQQPAIRLDHVEDLGKGILKDKKLLQLRRRPRKVGEQDEAFVANSIPGVIEYRYEPRSA